MPQLLGQAKGKKGSGRYSDRLLWVYWLSSAFACSREVAVEAEQAPKMPAAQALKLVAAEAEAGELGRE